MIHLSGLQTSHLAKPYATKPRAAYPIASKTPSLTKDMRDIRFGKFRRSGGDDSAFAFSERMGGKHTRNAVFASILGVLLLIAGGASIARSVATDNGIEGSSTHQTYIDGSNQMISASDLLASLKGQNADSRVCNIVTSAIHTYDDGMSTQSPSFQELKSQLAALPRCTPEDIQDLESYIEQIQNLDNHSTDDSPSNPTSAYKAIYDSFIGKLEARHPELFTPEKKALLQAAENKYFNLNHQFDNQEDIDFSMIIAGVAAVVFGLVSIGVARHENNEAWYWYTHD